MPDRDKIIRQMESLINYHRSIGNNITADIAEDAVTLLKEPETVEPIISTVQQRCGNCHKVIEMDGWVACPWCGKGINWDVRS